MAPIVRICAWCGRRKTDRSEGGPTRVSHGICAACALEFGGEPVEDLGLLSTAEFDALAWGTLQLDDLGVVRVYNRAEARLARRAVDDVLGKHFFREVAPCTAVQEFEGRFQDLVDRTRPGRAEFEFLFRFGHGPVRVRIAMSRDPERARTTVMVYPLDSPMPVDSLSSRTEPVNDLHA